MKVLFSFYSISRDLANTNEMAMDIPDGSTVKTALDRLIIVKPELTSIMSSSLFAVGNEYAPMSYELIEGNRISIIPPVQGG